MITKNEQETKEFAKEFLKGITSPKVIALEGELGAGKTTFIQGLAKSLGIEKRVLSPTFVFLRSYDLKDSRFKKFHHFDLYRCQTTADVKSIGLLEILEEKNSLVALEWPTIAKEFLPEDTIWIKFGKPSENEREIKVS